MDEVPLEGGRVNVGGVVRVGDTVRRPLRENSPFVHELLLQLERAGFDGAPRFLGRRLEDVGYLAWTALRLAPAGRPVEEQRRRLALLADAYETAVDDALLDAVGGAMTWLRTKGAAEGWEREVLTRIEGERRWFDEIRDYLR